MDKYNIVFVETPFSGVGILGRRAQDFVLREFADFPCKQSKIVKQSLYKEKDFCDDMINVVLPLDMPLVKKDDIISLVKTMTAKGVTCVKLGAYDSPAKVCIGVGDNGDVFSKDGCFLRIDSAKSFNVVYNQLKERILDRLLSLGVYVFDRATTFIDDTAIVEGGAVIMPFCTIEGESIIKSGATIRSSYLKDSVIEGGAMVDSSHLASSTVGENATVGPFARLRSANISKSCRVGDFVEVKASLLRDGVKASHLCYIGDADVGERTNVGCGTVFCNFDGEKKHKTTVGSECFIGANTNLIAPVVVGDNAFIAAGTTVTRDVEDGSFTIGRVRQDTKIKRTE